MWPFAKKPETKSVQVVRVWFANDREDIIGESQNTLMTKRKGWHKFRVVRERGGINGDIIKESREIPVNLDMATSMENISWYKEYKYIKP